ncbi:hypothetical protein [Geodermatophilus amargosae]|uniref:hypothetical protein n=1 Tax=Geodermatophilus amargosae TaxID=1296565 RepID=UPI0034E029DD
MPGAVGSSFDAEAVVDLGVVAFAQQGWVLQRGLAAVDPVDEVVDVGPPGGGIGEVVEVVEVDAGRDVRLDRPQRGQAARGQGAGRGCVRPRPGGRPAWRTRV